MMRPQFSMAPAPKSGIAIRSEVDKLHYDDLNLTKFPMKI